MLVEVTKSMFAVDRDNMLFHLIRGYGQSQEYTYFHAFTCSCQGKGVILDPYGSE